MASTPVRADLYWGLQLGDWSVPANWGGRLPTSSDTVYVVNGGTLTVTLPGELCGTLSLGGEGCGTVQMTGGGLSTNYQFVYNPVYNSGMGIFTQSGGTNSIAGCLFLDNGTGGSGTYSLSGSGLLSATGEYVGNSSAAGSFQQSGGSNATGALSDRPVANQRVMLPFRLPTCQRKFSAGRFRRSVIGWRTHVPSTRCPWSMHCFQPRPPEQRPNYRAAHSPKAGPGPHGEYGRALVNRQSLFIL